MEKSFIGLKEMLDLSERLRTENVSYSKVK